MDMLGKVRRMHMRDRLSISEIARRTGLSRNTVRRWLRAPGDLEPHYERSAGRRKLTDYEAILIAALKADRLRHKHSRRTARALFLQIKAQGYRGGYSRVTDFIRAWRSESRAGASGPRCESSVLQVLARSMSGLLSAALHCGWRRCIRCTQP
ncbi:MAG: transposase [Betaproteobacteria bacterium]|nr:transposase [Betaproteobacteria bacterium]